VLRLWSWALRGGSGLRGKSHRRGLSGGFFSSDVLRGFTMEAGIQIWVPKKRKSDI
jgi:hypothetical protein